MLLDAIPIWVLFVATIAAILTAIEVGYGRGMALNKRSQDEKESPVSAIAGAVLGLAAFMLAFAFGLVADRYDAKKGLVREEAIAIRTAWQRSDFLPEAERPVAAELLHQYVEKRVAFVEERNADRAHVQAALAEMRQLQDRLWDMAVANARKDMNSDVAALYIDSLNEVIGLHVMRVAIGLQARVPSEIWWVLYSITFLGMMGVGYQTGISGSKRTLAGPTLAVAFALVFALIASLDRPDSSVLMISQQSLVELRDEMAAKVAR